MVCRSTPGNSAITTIARNASRLHDVQVLSLFHEVRAEAPRSMHPPTPGDRNAWLGTMRDRAHALGLRDSRRADLLHRIGEAERRDVDGRTYYAWRNIEQRAIYARAAMDTHFEQIARTHDCTPAEAEAAFNALMHRDHRVDGQVPQAPEHLPFATTHLPRDRGTRYALAALHSHGVNITRSEALLRDAYRTIHANSDRLAAAAADDPANQCPDCGQFASPDGHTCPPPAATAEPDEDLARMRAETGTADREVNAASEQPATPTPATQAPVVLPSMAEAAALAEQRVRAFTAPSGRTSYRISDGRAFVSRDTACTVETAIVRREAILAHLTTELGSSATAEAHLADAQARFTRDDDARWVTPDGSTFDRYEEAVLHDLRAESDAHALREGLITASNQCPDCGQFADDTHTCPPATADSPQTGDDPVVMHMGDVAVTPPVRTSAAARRRRTPLRTYSVDGHTTARMTNLSEVRAALRENPTQRLDDVQVQFTLGDTRRTAVVSGAMTVTNTGQRRTRTRDRFIVAATSVEAPPETGTPLTRTLRCTCPDYRANYDCEHVRQAIEHVQALLNQRDPVAIAPAAAMETVAADLREDYDASVAASQAARESFAAADTGVSFREDMSAFQSVWDEAKAHFEAGEHRLPFMTENATNGLGARDGGRSVGIEIEVDFPEDMSFTAKEQVAREIYEAGLSDSPQVRPWHWRGREVGPRGQAYGGGYTDNPNMWSVEHDSSVDGLDGRRGCEIVSPIMYDTPETWRNLKTICDIVERNGGRVTPRTGLHINVGAADFNHTVGNHNRLIGLANAYEDVIVRMAHNPQSGPNHRGRDYCRPMSMPEDGFTSIAQAQRSVDPLAYGGSSHRAMINLDHVPAEGAPIQNSTRVEVRIFDGSIDPGRIQANTKLALGLVDAAVRGVEVPREAERAGTHRTRNVGANGRMRRLRGEEWERDTESFRSLMDTIFTRPEDKKHLTYAFAASRWQRR